ncbi:MAG: hypothetical protein ACO1N9_09325 [Flavobacterium sp.]
MKKLQLLLLFVTLVNCSSKKDAGFIGYLLSIDTEKSIYGELLKRNKNKPAIFYLEHLPDSKIKIHLIEQSGDFTSTNRKLFINDKYYPLIFETDYLFYTELKDGFPIVTTDKPVIKKSISSIKERTENPDAYGIIKKVLVIEHSTYWIIDKKRKLLETNVSR